MTYNIKVSSTFSKVVGFGAKPQGLVCRHKTQEVEEKQSSGLFFLGEPSSGVPSLLTKMGNPRRGFPLFVRREDGPCLRL